MPAGTISPGNSASSPEASASTWWWYFIRRMRLAMSRTTRIASATMSAVKRKPRIPGVMSDSSRPGRNSGVSPPPPPPGHQLVRAGSIAANEEVTYPVYRRLPPVQKLAKGFAKSWAAGCLVLWQRGGTVLGFLLRWCRRHNAQQPDLTARKRATGDPRGPLLQVTARSSHQQPHHSPLWRPPRTHSSTHPARKRP